MLECSQLDLHNTLKKLKNLGLNVFKKKTYEYINIFSSCLSVTLKIKKCIQNFPKGDVIMLHLSNLKCDFYAKT